MDSWHRPAGVRLRLVLVRHGEPEASAQGRCYGKLDVGLSDNGRAQMTRLATALVNVRLDAVYASPRVRALESARQLADVVVTEDRFSEIDFGAFEGRTYDEVAESHSDIYEKWMQRPTEVTFPDGESFSGMKARVLAGARRLRDTHDEGTIAVVSHGGVNRILLAEALGVADEDIFRMGQSYAAVSVIDDYPDSSVVRLMNASC